MLNTANNGDEVLQWTSHAELISHPDICGEEPGEPIIEFPFEEGWSLVGYRKSMYVLNVTAGTMVAYDFDRYNGDLHENFRFNVGNCTGGCVGYNHCYMAQPNSQTIVLYERRGRITETYEFPFRVQALAMDIRNDWFFVLSENDEFTCVYELVYDRDVGEQLGVIRNHAQYHEDAVGYGIEWVSGHENNGQLWMINDENGRVSQIDVDTNEWTCTGLVQSFQAVPVEEGSNFTIAHDGYNIWIYDSQTGIIRIYDDGIIEYYNCVGWDPLECSIESDDDIDAVAWLRMRDFCRWIRYSNSFSIQRS